MAPRAKSARVAAAGRGGAAGAAATGDAVADSSQPFSVASLPDEVVERLLACAEDVGKEEVVNMMIIRRASPRARYARQKRRQVSPYCIVAFKRADNERPRSKRFRSLGASNAALWRKVLAASGYEPRARQLLQSDYVEARLSAEPRSTVASLLSSKCAFCNNEGTHWCAHTRTAMIFATPLR